MAALGLGCGATAETDPGFSSANNAGGAPAAGGSAGAGSGSGGLVHTGGTAAGGAGPTQLGPPYPVVLVHGFFGFEQFAGFDFATYFYEVRESLSGSGETLVFTPAVDPFNTSENRAIQLATQVENILHLTGHSKVNLVGHSQGGLDARVLAHDHPEWVASVTSISSPHLGTPVCRRFGWGRSKQQSTRLLGLANQGCGPPTL